MRLAYYKDNVSPADRKDLDTLGKSKSDWRFNAQHHYLEHRTFEKFSHCELLQHVENALLPSNIIQNISNLNPTVTELEEEVWMWASSQSK